MIVLETAASKQRKNTSLQQNELIQRVNSPNT